MADPKECKDHLGKEYDSISEMCRAYKISRSGFKNRIKNGMSLEEALTAPKNYEKSVVDHLGNEYTNMNKMCEAYGMDCKTVTQRLERGVSLETALTVKSLPRTHRCKESTDHLGKTYSSFKEMCEAYNKTPRMVLNRIKTGMNLERALTQEIRAYNKNK